MGRCCALGITFSTEATTQLAGSSFLLAKVSRDDYHVLKIGAFRPAAKAGATRPSDQKQEDLRGRPKTHGGAVMKITAIVRRIAIAIVASLCLWPMLALRASAQTAPESNATEAVALELVARGAWSPSVNYVKDDLVTSRGSAWRARRANINKVPGSTAPSTALDWERFARGFNPFGAWLSTTTYHPDDLVLRLGSTWRARRTNLNVAPGFSPPTGSNSPPRATPVAIRWRTAAPARRRSISAAIPTPASSRHRRGKLRWSRTACCFSTTSAATTPPWASARSIPTPAVTPTPPWEPTRSRPTTSGQANTAVGRGALAG